MNRSVVSHVRRLGEGSSRGMRFQPQRSEVLGESALIPNSSHVGCGIQQRRGKRPVVLFPGRICPKWGTFTHFRGLCFTATRGHCIFFELEFKLIDAHIVNQYNRGIPSSLTRTRAIRIAILSERTGSAFRASGAAFIMKHQGFLK
jgi:hypothetical protein